jgi:hypothetical protein
MALPEVDCEVLVCGAGVAGCAAAIAASRAGRRTILVDKMIIPGGLTTAGLVRGYAPLCDVRGRQVAFGLAEEFFRASIKYGPGEWPDEWLDSPNGQWCSTPKFTPAAFVMGLDELLEEAGVELWWDTLVCDALVEAGRCVGVEVENKSGRVAIKAGAVIDATGDADVAFRAGAPRVEQENMLTTLSHHASLDEARKAVDAGSAAGMITGHMTGANFDGGGEFADARRYRGTRGSDVSEFVNESRRRMRTWYAREQARLGQDGRNDFYPVVLCTMADFRTTRRIDASVVLTSKDKDTRFDDAVSAILDWHGNRDIWELPYQTLLPRDVKGLLAAGRCISAADYAWEITRIIPICAQSGQVAGIAAAMAVENDTTPDALEIEALRGRLRADGFICRARELPEAKPVAAAAETPAPAPERH